MDTEVQETDGSDDGKSDKSERTQSVKEKIEAQPSLVGVKVITTENKASLVEFLQDGEYRRVVVPASKVKAGSVSEANLAAGAPHGRDWAEVEGLTPEIAHEFRRHGIWTDEDLLKKSAAARGALQKVLIVPLLARLLAMASKTRR